MPPEELSASIEVIKPEDVPHGVTPTPAPTSAAGAVTFELVPLVPPAEPPEVPPEVPPVTPPVAPPVVLPPLEVPTVKEIVTEKKVTRFIGVPEEVGKGEYMGVIWAISNEAAEDLAAASFGGKSEDYATDLYARAPRAYHVVRKPLPEVAPAATPAEVTTHFNGLEFGTEKEQKIRIQCPVDLSEHYVPVGTTEFKCPVDGTIIRIPSVS